MPSILDEARVIRAAISEAGFNIYEPLTEHTHLVYTKHELETLLQHELVGQVYDAPANKTRAKLAKQAVARALGYPAPERLRNTKPRFPGQDLDVHTQKRSNVQVYNDEVTPTRRYAVLSLDEVNRVRAVRVVEGTALAAYDKTGTLTSKYQARRRPGRTGSVVVSPNDTEAFIAELAPVDGLKAEALRRMLPTSKPRRGQVLSVAALHAQLLRLIGRVLDYSPSERRRGEELHRAACEVLGLGSYADTGQFPDIVCQALEVKLQLAGTIDLGLASPDGHEPAVTLSPRLRHRDARYLIAYARREGEEGLLIEQVVTTTGADFFEEFKRFGGLGKNSKLQIPLPVDFFESE